MTRKEEIRARLEKATPGPWMSIGLRIYTDESRRYFEDEVCVANKVQDAQLISKAPSDIDYLLNENQRLCEALERIGWKMMNHTPMELRAIARQALEGDTE